MKNQEDGDLFINHHYRVSSPQCCGDKVIWLYKLQDLRQHWSEKPVQTESTPLPVSIQREVPATSHQVSDDISQDDLVNTTDDNVDDCYSVNELRPGDIDIIAALGDSTIGATGELPIA